MNDIPRYKASAPLQTAFVTNADSCGDHLFTQIARTGNVAVYKRTRVSDEWSCGYETILIKTVKAGTVYVKGGKPTEVDTESYPGAASFGKTGWSYNNQKMAFAKFEELVKKEEDKTLVDDEPMTLGFATSMVEDEPTTVVKKNSDGVSIPSDEFTQADFAELNNLPPRGSVYNLLKSMIEKGLVKEAKRVSFGRGRPTVMYRGV